MQRYHGLSQHWPRVITYPYPFNTPASQQLYQFCSLKAVMFLGGLRSPKKYNDAWLLNAYAGQFSTITAQF